MYENTEWRTEREREKRTHLTIDFVRGNVPSSSWLTRTHAESRPPFVQLCNVLENVDLPEPGRPANINRRTEEVWTRSIIESVSYFFDTSVLLVFVAVKISKRPIRIKYNASSKSNWSALGGCPSSTLRFNWPRIP